MGIRIDVLNSVVVHASFFSYHSPLRFLKNSPNYQAHTLGWALHGTCKTFPKNASLQGITCSPCSHSITLSACGLRHTRPGLRPDIPQYVGHLMTGL